MKDAEVWAGSHDEFLKDVDWSRATTPLRQIICQIGPLAWPLLEETREQKK